MSSEYVLKAFPEWLPNSRITTWLSFVNVSLFPSQTWSKHLKFLLVRVGFWLESALERGRWLGFPAGASQVMLVEGETCGWSALGCWSWRLGNSSSLFLGEIVLYPDQRLFFNKPIQGRLESFYTHKINNNHLHMPGEFVFWETSVFTFIFRYISREAKNPNSASERCYFQIHIIAYSIWNCNFVVHFHFLVCNCFYHYSEKKKNLIGMLSSV